MASISEFHQTTRKRLAAHKCKACSLGLLSEQRNALSQDDWMHKEAELINEIALEKLLNQIPTAYQPDIFFDFALNLRDRGGRIALNKTNTTFVRIGLRT